MDQLHEISFDLMKIPPAIEQRYIFVGHLSRQQRHIIVLTITVKKYAINGRSYLIKLKQKYYKLVKVQFNGFKNVSPICRIRDIFEDTA